MKKKISILGLVLILIFSLAGCGSSNEEVEYDQAAMEYYADAIIQELSVMTEDDINNLKSMSDYELNYRLMASQYPIAADDFLTMLDAWTAGQEDCGAYIEFGEYTMETSSSGATLTATLTGEERTGEMSFAFDENMNMESITVNADYSIGEILKKAGLNTILGMGTVFVVLIFISFIISLFKYIPAIQEKFSKKGKVQASAPAPAPAAPAVAPAVEAVSDDSELIAVIAAAIAASEGTSTDGFIVRSIKRRKTNKWR